MSDDGSTVTNEAVFELLADWRCRIVLEYLRGRDGERVPYGSLLDHVIEAETEAYRGLVPLEHPSYVAEDLRHRVLPWLQADGLVEFDPAAGLIRYRRNRVIEEVLRVAATNGVTRRRRPG